ncbi:hypothetical protein PIB30_027178 [Stylosanthes scabra]|uniref:Uncharacterized protein n=1 Tax=Stylosanthes scabra TaxID=79078 RepID=A0ABU6RAW1_9FABA|nr:hypothetical protein [Stylosanthes scabra]
MDCLFDASGFIDANLLGSRAQEALRDYDPVESLTEDLKVLNLQKAVVEEEKLEAIRAKLKDEEDLKSAKLDALGKEKDEEIERLKRRESQCEELTDDAKGVVFATEGALKAQLAILVPDFDNA